MKKMLFIIFLGAYIWAFASDVDILKTKLNGAKGKERIEIGIKLINYYWNTNHDSLKYHLEKLIEYAQKNKYSKELANLYKLYGNFYFDNGNMEQSRKSYENAIQILEKTKDKNQIWYLYNALGNTYSNTGDLKSAIDNYLKALSYCNTNNNLAVIQNNIGKIYLELKNYKEALKYLKEAEKNCGEDKLKVKQIIYTNLGIAYDNSGNKNLSIKYHLKSFEINKKIQNLPGLSINYNNLGNYYSKREDFKKAIEYYKKAIEINEKRTAYDKMIYPLLNIANLYIELKEFKKAMKYLNRALLLSNKTNNLIMKARLLKNLYELNKKIDNYKIATDFLEKYVTLKDSLQKLNNKNELENLTLKYENEKKSKELQLFKTLYYKQKLIKTYLFFSFLFLSIVIFFVFIYLKKVTKINRDLEEQIERNKIIRKQLQEAKQNLEEIVKERTKELNEKNKILQEEISNKEKTLQTLKKYEFLVNNAQDMLVLINEDLEIELINKAFFDKLNPKENIMKLNAVEELWNKEQYKKILLKRIKEAFSGKEIHFQEYLSIMGLESRFYDIAFYPDKIYNKAKYVVVVARDITEYKSVQNQLAKAEKIAALGEITAELAHEIKNPVTIIKSTAQLLKENIDRYNKPKIKKFLEIFLETSQRISDIFNKLNDFVKKEKFDFKKIDLVKLINHSIKITKAQCKTKNIDIEFEHAAGKYEIMADEKQLYKVFLNLILNSLKAVKENGKIKIKLQKKSDTIIYKISDNGYGIKDEYKEKIFNPFFSTDKKGMGLGLSIVYKILKFHNAEIKVESRENIGTTFTIIFRGVYGKNFDSR